MSADGSMVVPPVLCGSDSTIFAGAGVATCAFWAGSGCPDPSHDGNFGSTNRTYFDQILCTATIVTATSKKPDQLRLDGRVFAYRGVASPSPVGSTSTGSFITVVIVAAASFRPRLTAGRRHFAVNVPVRAVTSVECLVAATCPGRIEAPQPVNAPPVLRRPRAWRVCRRLGTSTAWSGDIVADGVDRPLPGARIPVHSGDGRPRVGWGCDRWGRPNRYRARKREVSMTLAEIREKLARISLEWRSETAIEQRMDLAALDDLLGRLDDMQGGTAAGTETIDELRGRIEILMDEIDISLGIEPAPIAGLADLDVEPSAGVPVSDDGQQSDE